jgi:hypothetical protein
MGNVVDLDKGDSKIPLWKSPVGTGIIGGVISSLIVLYFIQPILSFLWHSVLSNFKGLVDEACLQAALGTTDKYHFLFMAYFILSVTSINIGFSLGLVGRYRKGTRARRGLSRRAILIVSIV